MATGNDSSPKRRLALKALGGSALAGGLIEKLPAVWRRPLVQTAVLPAHAQASLRPPPPAQIRLAVYDANNDRQGDPLALHYTLDRGSDGRVLRLTISAPGTAYAPGLADALFPAAYAQTDFRLQDRLVLSFPPDSLVASGDLQLNYRGQLCAIRIIARLLPNRMDLHVLDVETVDCGSSQIRKAPGENSGFGVINANPDRTYRWVWNSEDGEYTVTGTFTIEADAAGLGVIVAQHVQSHTYSVSRNQQEIYQFDLVRGVRTDSSNTEERRTPNHAFGYVVGRDSFSIVFLDLRIGGEGLYFDIGDLMYQLNVQSQTKTSRIPPVVWQGGDADRPAPPPPIPTLPPPPTGMPVTTPAPGATPIAVTTRHIPAEDRTYSWAWESGEYRAVGTFVVEAAEVGSGVIVAHQVESHDYIVWRGSMLLDAFDLIHSIRRSPDSPDPVNNPRAHIFSYQIGGDSFGASFLDFSIGGRGLRLTGGMYRLDHAGGSEISSTAPQVWKGAATDRPPP